MAKILAVLGSPNGERSNTRAMVNDFIELVKKYDDEIREEILMLEGLRYCQGCWACTKTGTCTINDGLQDIHQKMLAADLLIVGSPVYVHQM